MSKLDVSLIETMQIIIGCVHSTPSDYLLVLADVALLSLLRGNLTFSLLDKACAALTWPLHDCVTPANTKQRYLLSSTVHLLCNIATMHPAQHHGSQDEFLEFSMLSSD